MSYTACFHCVVLTWKFTKFSLDQCIVNSAYYIVHCSLALCGLYRMGQVIGARHLSIMGSDVLQSTVEYVVCTLWTVDQGR